MTQTGEGALNRGPHAAASCYFAPFRLIAVSYGVCYDASKLESALTLSYLSPFAVVVRASSEPMAGVSCNRQAEIGP
jgi:hypothetical protein